MVLSSYFWWSHVPHLQWESEDKTCYSYGPDQMVKYIRQLQFTTTPSKWCQLPSRNALRNFVSKFATLEWPDSSLQKFLNIRERTLTHFTNGYWSIPSMWFFWHEWAVERCDHLRYYVCQGSGQAPSNANTLNLQQCLTICRHYESLSLHIQQIHSGSDRQVEFLRKHHPKTKKYGQNKSQLKGQNSQKSQSQSQKGDNLVSGPW